jgi:hypothetical protein
MKASRWIGTFRRFLSSLLGTPKKRPPSRSVPRVVASRDGSVALPIPVARQPMRPPERAAEPVAPAVKQPVVIAPVEKARAPAPRPVKAEPPPPAVAPPLFLEELMQPVAQPAPQEPPAAIKPLRTLEEVRADLALLRASAKERHAQAQAQAQVQAQARRSAAFEPTDFMDFAKPEPPPSDDPESSFASTAYLDFTTLKPRESS